MVSRQGSKIKWVMANKNETWLDAATVRNIDKIYRFLKSNTNLESKNRPMYSYAQIAAHIGMNPRQVQFACQKLLYCKRPILRSHAITFGAKGVGKVSEKVELVREHK